MVEDAEFRVTALTVQIEGTVVFLVEVHTPFHQFLYLLGGFTNHLLYSFLVGDVIACDNGVGNVFVEGIDLHIGDRGHTSLCK